MRARILLVSFSAVALTGCSVLVDLGALSGSPDSGVAVDGGNKDVGGSGVAPRFVQANAVGLATAKTGSLPLLNSVKAGSAIVVCLTYDGGGTATIKDGQLNSYSYVQNVASTSVRYVIAVAFAKATGPLVVTPSIDVTPQSYFEAYALEYEGVSAVGATVWAEGDALNGVADGMKSGPGASAANELVFGFGVTGDTQVGTGFTARSTFHGNVIEDRAGVAPTSETTATQKKGSHWAMFFVGLRGT